MKRELNRTVNREGTAEADAQREQYRATAERIAAILADPHTPEQVKSALTDSVIEFFDKHKGVFSPEVLRVAYPVMCEAEGRDPFAALASPLLQGEQIADTPHVNSSPQSNTGEAKPYSPEVEARRVEYGRLAESLLTMIQLEMQHVHPLLDVTLRDMSPVYGDAEEAVLNRAIDKHLRLVCEAVDWYAPEALRGLYVELRLLADQQALERHEAYKQSQQEGDSQ